MLITKKNKRIITIILAMIIGGIIFYFILPHVYSNNIEYSIQTENNNLKNEKEIKEKIEEITPEENKKDVIQISHIKTPKEVKAIYMSGWVAGSENFRNSLLKIIDETEINAVVVDIKDSTGRISFHTDDIEIQKIGSSENRIKDIKEFTNLLHSKNIYIIGRISVFQDPYLAKLKPEWSIRKISDGGVWKDKKGLSFLDPTNKNVHDYTLSIALASYHLGFDEINLDYIRYPSDGNMKDINYNLNPGETREDNIEKFFKYFSSQIKKDIDIPISADLFGLTTENNTDMGIGQVWEKALPYFDYICPMVYPSHYPSGYLGYNKPALYPYEVIDRALKGAIMKTEAMGYDKNIIRPWLQDFDLGATYTKEMVKAQIKATYDNGLNSWLMWDPSNKYTPSAFELEKSI